MTRVEHTVEIGPPIAVGSRFVETTRLLGRWVEVTWRVTEHEPPARSAAEAGAES